MTFLSELFITAIIGGSLLALSTAPLGAFVLWRRMSYFGETLSHATLLGFVLSILIGINLYISLIYVVVLIAIILIFLEKKSKLSTDSLLGVIAHFSLSLGVVLVAIVASNIRVDVLDYLFGDILTMQTKDIITILIVSSIICSIITIKFRKLISTTLSPEIAHVEGINISHYKLLIVILLALVISISVKMVGGLMITSFLIIPAATVRGISRSPLQMIIKSYIVTIISLIIGMFTSLILNTPAGPSIVLVMSIIFTITLLVTNLKK